MCRVRSPKSSTKASCFELLSFGFVKNETSTLHCLLLSVCATHARIKGLWYSLGQPGRGMTSTTFSWRCSSWYAANSACVLFTGCLVFKFLFMWEWGHICATACVGQESLCLSNHVNSNDRTWVGLAAREPTEPPCQPQGCDFSKILHQVFPRIL